jgi:GxxExxY protein
MNDDKSAAGDNILFKDECYAIQGAIFEVYREMGCGFLEPVYQECLERELLLSGIPHRAKPELKLAYKGAVLTQTYEPDFICYDAVIIELNASPTPSFSCTSCLSWLNLTASLGDAGSRTMVKSSAR